MGGIELSRKVIELVWQEMSVSVHRDVDVRVAEVMLDGFRVNTAANEHRRAGVTKIVDPELMG